MGGYVREEGGGGGLYTLAQITHTYKYGTISPRSINQPKKPKIHRKRKRKK